MTPYARSVAGTALVLCGALLLSACTDEQPVPAGEELYPQLEVRRDGNQLPVRVDWTRARDDVRGTLLYETLTPLAACETVPDYAHYVMRVTPNAPFQQAYEAIIAWQNDPNNTRNPQVRADVIKGPLGCKEKLILTLRDQIAKDYALFFEAAGVRCLLHLITSDAYFQTGLREGALEFDGRGRYPNAPIAIHELTVAGVARGLARRFVETRGKSAADMHHQERFAYEDVALSVPFPIAESLLQVGEPELARALEQALNDLLDKNGLRYRRTVEVDAPVALRLWEQAKRRARAERAPAAAEDVGG